MVAVDCEDGQFYVHVMVLKVDLVLRMGQVVGMDGFGVLALDVVLEQVEAFVDGFLRGVDLVEQVAAQEDEIDVLLLGDGQDLLEGVE